ncbi:hypothetical protein [Chitinimonas sp.]|uniref:hypothetical protein n=1 Tax=Chitinimonas sp. TaxID=1934313 RepID=UPI0035B18685
MQHSEAAVIIEAIAESVRRTPSQTQTINQYGYYAGGGNQGGGPSFVANNSGGTGFSANLGMTGSSQQATSNVQNEVVTKLEEAAAELRKENPDVRSVQNLLASATQALPYLAPLVDLMKDLFAS